MLGSAGGRRACSTRIIARMGGGREAGVGSKEQGVGERRGDGETRERAMVRGTTTNLEWNEYGGKRCGGDGVPARRVGHIST